MKKNFLLSTVILSVILISTGCALLDSSVLNPPSWIIGTWEDDFEIIHWEFTSDNALLTTSTGSVLDYKAISTRDGSTITENSSTSDEFQFTYKTDSYTQVYTFTYVDDTTLYYDLNGTTVTIYKK